MDVDALRTAIVGLTFGKRLPTAIYVWDQTGEQLPPILRTVCAELRRRLNAMSLTRIDPPLLS